MTDDFHIDVRVDDRLEGLTRTLLDPFLSREMKVEELANALERIRVLEEQRPMAEVLSIFADAATPRGDAARPALCW